jgi:hypothetical protein
MKKPLLKWLLVHWLATLLLEVLAFVLFFWCDWRIGAGYACVWLNDFVSAESIKAARSAFTIARNTVADMKKEDQ